VKFRDQEPSFPSFVHIGWRQVKRERGARRSGGARRPRCWRQVQFSRDGRYLNFGDTLVTRLWLACDASQALVTRHKRVTSESQASHKQVTTYLWRFASESQANHKRDLCMYIHIANSFLPSGLADLVYLQDFVKGRICFLEIRWWFIYSPVLSSSDP